VEGGLLEFGGRTRENGRRLIQKIFYLQQRRFSEDIDLFACGVDCNDFNAFLKRSTATAWLDRAGFFVSRTAGWI